MSTEALLSIIAQAQTCIKSAWKQGKSGSNQHLVTVAQFELMTRTDPIFCDVLGQIIEAATQTLYANEVHQ